MIGGFLMPSLCHFGDWLCVVWFLDLGATPPLPHLYPTSTTSRGSSVTTHTPTHLYHLYLYLERSSILFFNIYILKYFY